MEAGIWDHTSEAADCKRNGCPNLKGWGGTENRECNLEGSIQEEVTSFRTTIALKGSKTSINENPSAYIKSINNG